MDLLNAIYTRHAVRSYLDKPIEPELRQVLQNIVSECNKEGGLNIQLVFDEPNAFDSFMAHYGKFSGVKNYVALIGPKNAEEKIGYYGERIALSAQTLGLNTCWVAMSYKKVKNAYNVGSGEKLHLVLALGYGANQGTPHVSKTPEQVSYANNAPEWFNAGVKAALLAPTAMNQQKFKFSYENGNVRATPGFGFYVKADLGIAKYHFELASGDTEFSWIK